MAEINTLEDLVNGPVKIICQGNCAKNHPAETNPAVYTHIIFDQTPGEKYEKWIIEKYEDSNTYTIRNVGTRYWARLYGEVNGTPEFDEGSCLWSITSAGEGVYNIKVPSADDMWTVRAKGPGFPLTVFADPAKGALNQHLSFAMAE